MVTKMTETKEPLSSKTLQCETCSLSFPVISPVPPTPLSKADTHWLQQLPRVAPLHQSSWAELDTEEF